MPSPPPGPPGLPWIGHAPWFLRDKPAFLLRCYRRYGDVVKLDLGGPTFLVVAPRDVRHVLVENADNYGKSPRVVGDAARRALGGNVLTTEGAAHRRLRQALQSCFRQATLEPLEAGIAQRAAAAAREWCERGEVDAVAEMQRLTAHCLVAVLFGERSPARHARIAEGLEMRRRYVETLFAFPAIAAGARSHRFRRRSQELDVILDDAVRSGGEDGSLLRSITSGSGLEPSELHEQVGALLLAGYETTASLLTWCTYLLARDGQEQRRCLAHDGASMERRSRMDCFVDEALRLYSPTWLFVRVARGADCLPSGVDLPAGAKVYLSQYVSHRQPRIFPDPERFDPSRFAHELPSPFAYFPFGGGARHCLGEALAKLLTVTILRNVLIVGEASLVTNDPPRALAELTYHPQGPVRIKMRRRSDAQ